MSDIVEKYSINDELSLKERLKIKNRRQYLLRKQAGKIELKNKNKSSKDPTIPEPTGKKGRPSNKYTKTEFLELLEENNKLKEQLQFG